MTSGQLVYTSKKCPKAGFTAAFDTKTSIAPKLSIAYRLYINIYILIYIYIQYTVYIYILYNRLYNITV